MTGERRLSLRTKLLAGVALVAALVVVLLLTAHHFVSESAARMEASLQAEIRPLVRINHLQSQLDTLRIAEAEMPRLSDYFAVTSQIELLRAQSNLFGQSLREFSRTASLPAGMDEAWSRYAEDLRRTTEHATRMDMAAVEAISTYESAPRFKFIARGLQELAEQTEARAQAALEAERERHLRQQTLFGAISFFGLGVLLVGALWLSRSLSSRIGSLRDATQRLAEGVSDVPPDRRGNDELADLASAFVVMRDRIRLREDELRCAQSELEDRVQERTQALSESNEMLRREIAERTRAETQLHLLREAVEQSPVGVMITDADTRIEYVNPAFLKSAGYALEAVIGKTPALVFSGENRRELYQEMWDTLVRGESWSGEFINRRSDGELYWEFERISPVTDGDGAVTHYLAIREDITERKQQEEKIVFQAHYDHLTKLPNRILAGDRLTQAIAAAKRGGSRVAAMFVDLDDFKKVNDTLGHEAGDHLLIEAAQRLVACVRETDTVARLGGDEFLVVVSNVGSAVDIENVAAKIVGAFRPAVMLGEHEVVVTPSVGLAVYPEDGQDVATLLRNADLAMYDAKGAGRNTWRFFNRAAHAQSVHRLALENDLRLALERGELQVHYQPLIDVASRAVVGAEALLRWQHPQHGLVPPDRFIPLAEQSGLIVDIGDWVLRSACAQAVAWRVGSHREFRMAVNVSPRQFRQAGFVDRLYETLGGVGLPSSGLQIEITEGLLLRSDAEIRAILFALDRGGVRMAMDDFGTGYSSLSYLRRFPFHTLKIDREFIRDLSEDPNDRALVGAAIVMGKQLGLTVVAEGVETEAQLACLAEQGCDVVQGYYFGRPVPAAEFGAVWIGMPYDFII